MRNIDSFKDVVGEEVYSVWLDMLKELVPDGRTERLRMLVAGMARYTSQKFAKKYRKPLLLSEESYDEEEFSNELLPLIHKLFDDAGVEYSRINCHGEAYCVAEEAAFQYICWYNMPWE